MTLLAVYLSIAICISFLCSLLESVILSVSYAYVAVLVKQGKKSGLILNELRNNIDRPLAAILTLNTISHTVGAAGVGAQVEQIWGNHYVAIASAVLTFVILVFSEIIPKTLGATHWKKLAPLCAYLIKWMITLTYPFVLLSREISIYLSRGKAQKVTREEMIETAEMGANEGTIHKKESRIIKNLLMLDNVKVSDVMTPRSVLLALSVKDKVGDIMQKNKTIRFSRIPVFDGNLDNIVGMVHRYKILEAVSQDLHDLTIEKLKVGIHSVPEDISVGAALDQFIKRKEHLFLVVDTYGVTAGIVTLEDAIETLLGVEIVDEFDSVEDMRQFALEQWRARKTKMGNGS